MRDLCLRFNSEAAWVTADIDRDPGRLEIDVVGTIIRVVDPLANPTIMERLDGWHVNVRCVDGRDLSDLQLYVVTPAHPTRVWA